MKYGEVSLGQIEALINLVGGKAEMKRILSGERILNTRALRRVGNPLSLPLLGGGGIFLPSQHFVVNSDGEVPIVSINETFRHNFLDLQEAIVPLIVCEYTLSHGMKSCQIINAFGDEWKSTVGLQHVYQFLRFADRTLSNWFLFCVLDSRRAPWMINACWVEESAWKISAHTLINASAGWTYYNMFVGPYIE
jgi:hypothetical protein